MKNLKLFFFIRNAAKRSTKITKTNTKKEKKKS